MTTTRLETARALRRRAEEQYRLDEATDSQTLSLEETQILLHDLRIHQIELEMQNEELRLKQLELETAKARYFDLYDLAPMGYLTFNAQGLIYEANLSAATMLGVTRTVLFRDLMAKFLFHKDQEIYYHHRKKLLETGEVQAWDMRLMRADGSTFWANLQSTPLHNGEYSIVFSNIDDRKRAEEEKHMLEQQLHQTQKLESLCVLSGGIAHDFNNILAIIMGYCALTKMDHETTEKNILEIEKAVERAAALCRQMLAYAGKAQLAKTQVNMLTKVSEIVGMLKLTLPKNAVINTDLSAKIPLIDADASQLSQIVMNLIINASEAIGKEHGEIQVSLANTKVIAGQSDKDYNGKAIPPGGYILLQVTDNGCGMDEETKQRIFEPFYTTKFPGRGLGMSAVLGIIKSHGGALQLFSQPGQGSTFKVYLPAPTGDTALNEDQTASAPSAPWQASGTILLVEDEDQVRLIAKMLLKRFGFTVLEAVNGKEALEMYQRNAAEITIVFTDIGMPVMDGYELFHALKKLKPELPIIVSSGYGNAEVSSRIGSDNIAGLISKPYNYDQLLEVLKRAVG